MIVKATITKTGQSVAKLDELMHSLGMRLSVEPVGMAAAQAAVNA